MLTVSLVNDNAPVVDLNGPMQPSINYTTTLTYDFFSPAQVPIASSDAVVSDADLDGRLVSLAVQLEPGRPGDRLVFPACPSEGDASCQLR